MLDKVHHGVVHDLIVGVLVRQAVDLPLPLGAVWFRGYPPVARGSHQKSGCHVFGLKGESGWG
jgi:hypothetical protein